MTITVLVPVSARLLLFAAWGAASTVWVCAWDWASGWAFGSSVAPSAETLPSLSSDVAAAAVDFFVFTGAGLVSLDRSSLDWSSLEVSSVAELSVLVADWLWSL